MVCVLHYDLVDGQCRPQKDQAQEYAMQMPTPIRHATSEHIFSADEMEFLAAIEEFKRATGKKFPTWSEALSVLRGLGYRKADENTELSFA